MKQDDPDFELYRLFHGGIARDTRIGAIPLYAQRRLNWGSRIVYLSPETARKITNHPKHALAWKYSRLIGEVVAFGEMMHDKEGYLVFARRISCISNSYLFVAAKIDGHETGIFVRTFFKKEAKRVDALRKKSIILRAEMTMAA